MTDRTGDGRRRSGTPSPDPGPGRSATTYTARHTRRLECRTVATGRFGQSHHIRDLPAIVGGSASVDSPTLLGDDVEPHPSEMLLAVLNACLSVSFQANAVARGIPVRALEVRSIDDMDPSALWGTRERRVRPIGFHSIEVRVEAEAPRKALQALVDYAMLWSPVANTLHDPVDLRASLVPV